MNTMQLMTRFYRLMNLYNAKSKKPHTYRSGLVLYPAQAHMIEMIGEQEGITSTEIAAQYCITKGAVSQITTFLDEKGLIVKQPSQKGGRTMELYLSEEGKRIFIEHRERHRGMLDDVSELAERLSPETIEILSQIADRIENNIDAL